MFFVYFVLFFVVSYSLSMYSARMRLFSPLLANKCEGDINKIHNDDGNNNYHAATMATVDDCFTSAKRCYCERCIKKKTKLVSLPLRIISMPCIYYVCSFFTSFQFVQPCIRRWLLLMRNVGNKYFYSLLKFAINVGTMVV